MDFFSNSVLILSGFSMIFEGAIKLMAIYTMYLAIKSFKIYIKKNS